MVCANVYGVCAYVHIYIITMCVCVHVCICGCACATVHVWKSDDSFKCWFSSFTLSEAESPAACHCMQQASWPVKSERFSCLCLLFCCGSIGIKKHVTMHDFAGVLGTQTHIFILVQQMLSLLSILLI